MRTIFPALAAFLLSTTAATAQVSARETCPATVDATYTRVGPVDFGVSPDPKLDIAGWQPRFAPATLRLIGTGVNFGADAKREIVSNMPDNADEAKPGDPLIYTIWPKGAKKPASPAYILCEYEGGLAFQKALPSAARVCTLRTTGRKAAASETTTRELIATAEISCR